MLVIAHRPSALNTVDHVAMINAGRLSAFGPKDEVMKKVLLHPRFEPLSVDELKRERSQP